MKPSASESESNGHCEIHPVDALAGMFAISPPARRDEGR